MSTDENKAVVRLSFEEAWNCSNLSVADETYSADNIHHFGRFPGPLGPDQSGAKWRTAIADYRYHIEDTVAKGDMVATRLRFTGSHASASLRFASRLAIPPPGSGGPS